ncbi:MAG: hypothetical protein HGA87_02000 [Desulfobulbaceae bacterium]|nr:hypothetical protein [Desulfobulbaceae bacterium]
MKEFLLSSQFITIISVVIGLYIFHKTKEAERESEWRKEKLNLYLKFVESLSGITDSEITDEGEIGFAKACNDLHALAPQNVLKALHGYQEQIRITNHHSSVESKRKALNKLIFEMRRDLKIKPQDKEEECLMLLWTSGKRRSR